MTKQDEPRFIEIMLGMADNFRDTITEQGLNIRFSMLSGYSIEQIEKAAKKIMFTRKYTKMPPVAEFIEAIDGSTSSHAEIQATYVISCIGQTNPVFDDPITKHLMAKRWQWSTWARTVLEKELTWWAKDFKDAYSAYRAIPELTMIENTNAKKISGLISGIGGD